MSLELLEKFVTQLAPVRAHQPIKAAFDDIRKQPIQAMGQGFHLLRDDMKDDASPLSAAAVNGVLLGIALSHGCTVSKDMTRMIEEYLEQNKKGRGENVIDFAALRKRS